MGKGRSPCCDKAGVKKGPWSQAEDLKLISFIHKHGHSNWRALPKLAGLARCGKSCRLRWINYLRPDLKRGNFTPQEEEAIIKLHEVLGNKWSKIASHFPGRTDNEIKNVWNTHLKKRIKSKGFDKGNKDCSQQDFIHQTSPTNDSSSSSFPDHQVHELNPEVDQGSPKSNMIEDVYEEKIKDDLVDELIEIPFEPNLDLWDLLDGDANSAESEVQFNDDDSLLYPISESDNKNSSESDGNWWWLVYLENELGLDHSSVSKPLQASSTGSNQELLFKEEKNCVHIWPSKFT